MNTNFLKVAIGWGILLWLVGYLLGFALFAFVPTAILGWIIMPFGILMTLWVLIKKVPSGSTTQDLYLGLIWVLIAIVLDYFLLVQLLHPADGYYKLDVFLYYILTVSLPLLIGLHKRKKKVILDH